MNDPFDVWHLLILQTPEIIVIDSGSYSSSDNNPMCLPINATESTTVSNCNCFTQVYGYMNGGMSQGTMRGEKKEGGHYTTVYC